MITLCAWLLATFLQEEDLFPLQEGNTWIYATNGKADITFDVAGTEKVGKRDCAILRIRGGDQESKLWLARDKDGIKVVRKSDAGGKAETLFVPTLFLKVPCKNGDKWKAGPEEYVVSGPEEIQEGGKTYSCMKVTITDRSEEGATQEYWFAPGVGPVKWTWAGGGQKVVCDLKELRKKEPEKAPLQCAKCGCAMQETDKFCCGCGARREEGEKSEKAVCANCGAKFQGNEKFCAACGAKREGPPQVRGVSFEEALLCTVPETFLILKCHFGLDGRHAACRVKGMRGGRERQWVIVEENSSAAFDAVFGPVQWSRDGGTIAFGAAREGEGYCVVAGNPQGKSGEMTGLAERREAGQVRDLVLSPDGTRVAYVRVTQGKAATVVVGDEAGEEFERIQGLCFCPDGSTVAYAGSKDGKSRVVLGGRKGAEYASAHSLAFSPDGKILAYCAGRGERDAFVVVGDKEGKSYSEVARPVFNADGSRVAYWAKDKDGERVVVNEQPAKAFKRVCPWTITFSPDGRRLAYAVETENGRSVVVDGDVGPVIDAREIDKIVFRPDGTKIAVVAVSPNGSQWVGVGEMKTEEYADVGTPVFSADGKKIAFGAQKGREIRWIVRDVP